MRCITVGALLVAMASGLAAQAPTFEVASVRPNRSGEPRVRFALPPGRFTVTNAPLRDIVRQAYQLSDFQLVNLPEWAAEERFDIEATTRAAGVDEPPMMLGPAGPPPGLRLMLRALLADRFKLAAHLETRELPVYALVLARRNQSLGAAMAHSTLDCAALASALLARAGGPPKPPAPGQPPRCGMFSVPGRLEGWSVPLDEFAQFLTPLMGRVVIDRTGLAGGFDLTLTFTPQATSQVQAAGSPLSRSDWPGPTLEAALEEQLGLRLESSRSPVDVLVIDTVSRPSPD
jgi:uncharacterized protein (TIGR03435 family)